MTLFEIGLEIKVEHNYNFGKKYTYIPKMTIRKYAKITSVLTQM